MDRTSLKHLLKNYRTPFEEEQAFILGFIQLTSDPLAYVRDRREGHFTASAWIMNKQRTHVLLTLHNKLNRWLQLGGHADGNENLLQVAMDEAREESGLSSLRLIDQSIFDIDKHGIPANDRERQHFHYDIRFLLEAEIGEPLRISKESKELAWVSFDSVAKTVQYNNSILRMLKKTSKSEILL